MTDLFARQEHEAPSTGAENGLHFHTQLPHRGMRWLPAAAWGHLCRGVHALDGVLAWMMARAAAQISISASPPLFKPP